MPLLIREMSKEYAEKNDVTVEELLIAIFCFHECGEHLGHPFVTLFSDGSGAVMNRTGIDIIFSFGNLKQLVDHSKELMQKHGIVWDESEKAYEKRQNKNRRKKKCINKFMRFQSLEMDNG